MKKCKKHACVLTLKPFINVSFSFLPCPELEVILKQHFVDVFFFKGTVLCGDDCVRVKASVDPSLLSCFHIIVGNCREWVVDKPYRVGHSCRKCFVDRCTQWVANGCWRVGYKVIDGGL